MDNLKISLIGYGKMGKEVERIAEQKGIQVVSIIDPVKEFAYKEISPESIKDADVCVDFTTPEAFIKNFDKLAELKKSIVVGTTGWYDSLDEVKDKVKSSGIGFVYAPNFSIGVNIFYKVIENASGLFNNVKEYDMFGYELHHKMKLDSPSGTAKMLASKIMKDTKKEISFASIRSGFIPGTHVVGFDSEADTIELKHSARNRSGFALGAILVALWLKDKQGFYEIEDFMNSLLEDKK